MKKVTEQVSGYTYAQTVVAHSAIGLEDLDSLKVSAGFTAEDERYLQMAGEVLGNQTKEIVAHWRSGIIAQIPNLARHSRSLEGEAIPDYLAKSNLRFEQWILDTCFRPYDHDWINYQQEIALRHTSLKKNVTDGANSTGYVPLRDIIAFVAVMNETILPYLSARQDSLEDINRMHSAWCKSMQLQIALWTKLYAERVPNEW